MSVTGVSLTSKGGGLDISDAGFKTKFGRNWQTYKKIYEAASPDERAALKKCMDGPNRWQAFSTFKQLKTLQTKLNGGGKAKLPDSVVRTITLGVAVPRTSAPNGREGLMGPAQAMQAARAYASMNATDRASFDTLLAKAGQANDRKTRAGADPETERGLLLKALAARRNQVESSASGSLRGRAMNEVTDFANAIRGMDRAALIRKTTLLDVDDRSNDSRLNPEELDETGRTGSPRWNDHDKSNDGLFQRYTMSCGPASVEVLLGERDPIHAFKVHQDGAGSATTRSTAGAYQKSLMKKYAGHYQARLAVYNYHRSKNNLDDLVAKGTVTAAQRDACLAYLAGKGSLNNDAKAGIKALRTKTGGFPSGRLVKEMRANDPTGPLIGISDAQMKQMLRGLSHATGVTYDMLKVLPHRTAVPQAAVDRVAKDLGSGIDVVFSTRTHFWSMSAVKGTHPNRSFLVHDTASGKTRWVSESDLKSGTFIKKFYPGYADATDGVEYFFPSK